MSDIRCLFVIRFKQTPTVSLDQPQISEWPTWLATHCLQKSLRQPLQLYMCSVVALCVATTVFLVCSQVVWKWIDGKLTKLIDGKMDAEDALPLQPTTSQLPRPQEDDQDSANDWASLFGLDMSVVPHAQDMPHTANICTALASAGIPQVSERPMGWAVENGSKMRDVVHLSCCACLTPAEKDMHAANIIVFLRMQRATLFSGSEGQELVVKDVCFSLLVFLTTC